MTPTSLIAQTIQDTVAPVAPPRRTLRRKHGETRVDHYAWLQKKQDRAMLDYLHAENAYAATVTAPLQAYREALYQEMRARMQEADMSVPYRLRDWWYYSRTEVGKQYAFLCRKSATAGDAAPEHLLLDLNRLAEGQSFLDIGDEALSDNDRFYAFTTDTTGAGEYTLHIKDLETDQLLPMQRHHVTSLVWAADNSTLFYTTEDEETQQSNQLWKHVLGTARDTRIYKENDEAFDLEVDRTRSRTYLLLMSYSHTTSEVRYLPAHTPEGRWQLVRKRQANIEYDVEHHSDLFYLRINDTGGNFRLVAMPIATPQPAHWREIVPHRPDVMLEDIDLFQHYCVLHERQQGLPQMTILTLASGEMHQITFDEPSYSLTGDHNPVWETQTFRYVYESLTTPATVYDYDMATRTRVLRKRDPMPESFDAAQYITERLYAPAADGTALPVSLVYRRDTPRDGSAPLWLEGYGAYGDPEDVEFASERLSLLDRGVIYAVAHIRGGGDLGAAWHDAGRLLHKMNTFTDFIAVAEMLIRERYTTSDRLAIAGNSAGGLLLGAVVNMRPELWKVVLAEVPFVDVLSTMLDDSLPLTIGEYEEWGDPNIKKYYQYIRQYSPYDQITAQAYPAMLVKTSLHDSRVMYWEPAKYVAKLRATRTNTAPLLLVTDMSAGHAGASGRYEHVHETAYDYAFVLDQLGIHPAAVG